MTGGLFLLCVFGAAVLGGIVAGLIVKMAMSQWLARPPEEFK